MAKLTDLDPMPFGKHQGTVMQDVPSSYLHWYYTETDRSNKEVTEYIEENLDALKEEYKNGIWEI